MSVNSTPGNAASASSMRCEDSATKVFETTTTRTPTVSLPAPRPPVARSEACDLGVERAGLRRHTPPVELLGVGQSARAQVGGKLRRHQCAIDRRADLV